MKKTVIAPANIAFIKYWGKVDEVLRIPANTSISMNLSAAHTTTTVDFMESLRTDEVNLTGGEFTDVEKQKVVAHLERIREKAGIATHARVVTQNSFPKGAGIASSASGFAALTVAASAAAGLVLSEKELSILARLGSGSACRSIPDGFVQWDTLYAYSLYPHTHWDLHDIIAVVSDEEKKIPSAGGMKDVSTSPLWKKRLAALPGRIEQITNALKDRNVALFGAAVEADCLSMHEVMQTQVPPLVYWTDATKKLMNAAHDMRRQGIAVYFTIDAGPNVHLICEAKNEERVVQKIQTMKEARAVIVNTPAPGAQLIDKHLF